MFCHLLLLHILILRQAVTESGCLVSQSPVGDYWKKQEERSRRKRDMGKEEYRGRRGFTRILREV